jgi:hypothetical protein
VIAPPLVVADLDPAKGVVEEAIGRELAAANIVPLALDEKAFEALTECNKKMSCLSKVAKSRGASHVLHVILARKGEEVLAQLTLLSVDRPKPVDTVRGKSGLGLDQIEGAVTNAVRQVIKSMKAFPQFKNSDVVSAALPSIPGVRADPPPGQSAAKDPTPATLPSGKPPTPRTAEPTPPPDTPPPTTIASAPTPDPKLGTSTQVQTRRGPNYWAYTLGGLGLVGALGGTLELIAANSDLSDRNNTPQIMVQHRQDLLDSGQSKQKVGLGLVVGGGVLVGLAIIFMIAGIGASSSSQDTASASSSANAQTFLRF